MKHLHTSYMKFVLLLSLCMGTVIISRAQYVYTIKADSVKLTNSCDSTELILLNHTQGVNGFLYNPGTGRTYFQRGLLKLSDSTYLIGADTLKVIPFGNAVLLNPSSPQNGNVSIIGTMSVQGMIDATNNINISNGGFLYVGGSYLTPQLVAAPGTFTDSLWVGPSYGAATPAFEVHSSGLATYSSDYGSLFTPRTLVDKGYVDSSVLTVKPTLNNVLTNGNTANTSIVMSNTIPILYTNVQNTSKVDSFYLDNTNHFHAGNSALTWDSSGNVFVKDTLTTGAVGLEIPNGGSIFSRQNNGLIRSLISYDNANVFHIAKGPEFDNGMLLNGNATLTTDSSFTIGSSAYSLSNLYVKPPVWNGSDAITILAKDNNTATEGLVTVPLSNFASASGSANYIQNQNATQQTGNFYISGAANSSVQITSAGTSAGGVTHHFFESSGTQRWGMGLSGAESGSNTGSNLYLARTADNGSALDFPFTITRSTGLVTLADGLTSAGTTTLTGLGAGLVQSSSTGVLSSAALTSTQVTTALGFTPLSSTSGVTTFNGSSGAITYSPTLTTVLTNGATTALTPTFQAPVYALNTTKSVAHGANPGYATQDSSYTRFWMNPDANVFLIGGNGNVAPTAAPIEIGANGANTIRFPYLSTGFLQSDASGDISSAALSSSQVTTALGFTPLSSTTGVTSFNGSVGAVTYNPTLQTVLSNGATATSVPLINVTTGPGMEIAQTTAGTANYVAYLASNNVGNWASLGVTSTTWSNDWRSPTDAYLSAAAGVDILTGSNGFNIRFGNNVSTFANFNGSTGNLNLADNLVLGTAYTTASTTPALLNEGASYGTNAVGSYANAKLRIYDNGSAYMGFGASSLNFEFNNIASGNYTFYSAGTQIAQLSSTGVFTSKGVAPSADSTYTNGSSSASWSQIYVKPPSWNGTDVVSILGQDYTTRGLVTIPQTSLGKNFIQNQFSTQQIAAYDILDTVSNSTSGGITGELSHTFNWTANTTLTGGALFDATYTNTTHNISLPAGGKQTIPTSVVSTSNFNRLTLTSSTVGIDSLNITNPFGNTPGVLAGTSTQVYFPNISYSTYAAVSGVAAEVIKSAYTDNTTLRTVRATNYYQLLIEPSDALLGDTTTTNNYAIYQSGASDLNVFNGSIQYANKYSSSTAPTYVTSTGAGTSASMSVSGTTDGGILTITTGTSPATSATVAILTFSNFSFPHGCSVVLYPANASAAVLSGGQAVYAVGSAVGFTISSSTGALLASTQYKWNYQVSGY
jgi:hypothetical protein